MTNGMVNGRARLAMALTVLPPCVRRPRPARRSGRSASSSSDSKQTVNFTIGYFALKGLESRVDDDVLLNELHERRNRCSSR